MAQEKDLYEVLGLKKEDNPSEDQIKKAFRKNALKWHPDRHTNDPEDKKKEAEDKFKEATRAYEVLSDPDKKAKYDQFGIVDDGSSSGGFDPFSAFKKGGFGGFDPFADFRDIFGGGGSGFTQNDYTQPGQNVRIRVPVSLEDVYNGVKKKIKYNIYVRCPNCHGSGGKTHKCEHCHGTGRITEVQRNGFSVIQTTKACPHCNGTGEIVEQKCPSCGGTGFKTQEKIFEIEFPAGIQDGYGVEYSGEGSESKKPGGSNGNLIVLAAWKFDTERYSVDDTDITEKLKIGYWDAILGTKHIVTLPNGKDVAINIAPCTPPGKRLSLRGMGIKAKDSWGRQVQGNYIVEITYDIPESLSDEEMKLLTKIKKLHEQKKRANNSKKKATQD